MTAINHLQVFIYALCTLISGFLLIYYIYIYGKRILHHEHAYLAIFVSTFGWALFSLLQSVLLDRYIWTVLNAVSYYFIYGIALAIVFIGITFIGPNKRSNLRFVYYLLFIYILTLLTYQLLAAVAFSYPNPFTAAILSEPSAYGPYTEVHGPLFYALFYPSMLVVFAFIIIFMYHAITSRSPVIKKRSSYFAVYLMVGFIGEITYTISSKILSTPGIVDHTLISSSIATTILIYALIQNRDVFFFERSDADWARMMDRGLEPGHLYLVDNEGFDTPEEIVSWVCDTLLSFRVPVLLVHVGGADLGPFGDMEHVHVIELGKRGKRDALSYLREIRNAVPDDFKGLVIIYNSDELYSSQLNRGGLEELINLFEIYQAELKKDVERLNSVIVFVGHRKDSIVEEIIFKENMLYIHPDEKRGFVIRKETITKETAHVLYNLYLKMREVDQEKRQRIKALEAHKMELDILANSLYHEINTAATLCVGYAPLWKGHDNTGDVLGAAMRLKDETDKAMGILRKSYTEGRSDRGHYKITIKDLVSEIHSTIPSGLLVSFDDPGVLDKRVGLSEKIMIEHLSRFIRAQNGRNIEMDIKSDGSGIELNLRWVDDHPTPVENRLSVDINGRLALNVLSNIGGQYKLWPSTREKGGKGSRQGITVYISLSAPPCKK